MVFNQNFTPHGSTLLNNSGYKLVTIRRKTLFTHEWANKNIFFVKDLMDKHGIFLDHKLFIDRFNLDCSSREYNSVRKAIPRYYPKDTITDSTVSIKLAELKIGDTKKDRSNRVTANALKQKRFADFRNPVSVALLEN